jgi:autotransporter-associated beta strand protein
MKTLRTTTPHRLTSALLALSLSGIPAIQAADGTWNLNNNGNWSSTGSWLDGNIADGAGSIADFSLLNITSNRTATIDTTPRVIGTLRFGDTTASPTFNNYTIAASNGGTLTFNNNGSTAVITQGADSGANTISAPVFLADSLDINNNSGSTLTVSGTISSSTAGTKTLTNQGSGAGGTTLSGIISNGSGSVAIVQNSATSNLTLSGANTFDTGVLVKQGTLIANNAAALGTGTVLIGDTSGSADATLAIGSVTVANNIIVQAGSSGKLTLSNTSTGSSARPTGNILLNNDLTITADGTRTNSNQGALFSASGTISGSGDLNLNVTGALSTSNNTNSPQMDNLSLTGPITTTGEIHNVGAGTGRATISGAISNAASINQDSATSLLSLSGTNTYTGATNINAGILRITTGAALPTNNTVNVASGATFQLSNSTSTAFGAGSTVNISGAGNNASHGAIETTNSSNYAGAVVLQDDATIASGLTNTTLTLSGTITGSGKTLTVAGGGNTAISAVIDTGSGGLIKEGTGTATLSAPTGNTYTGLTQINAGTLALGGTDALGGGGDITFNGGNLRHSGSNTVDYSGRIVNSTGPIAIDTNGQNVTYAGNIAASNTGGLTKLGSSRLTLSGTNAFTGPIAVNNGVLAVTTASAIPSLGTGSLFIDGNGALNSGGAYANVQDWLDSDNISTASTGAIALTGGSSENIDFTGYDSLNLGASSNATYTGTITAANSTYRLGGGGATLTLSGTNALTGGNALVVSGGNVTLSGTNDLSGATTVAANTLTLSFGGSLENSAVSVQPGATLAITANTSETPATRAAAVTLNRGTLTVTGNSVGNSTDTITGNLTLGAGGNSTVTLAQSNAKNVLLTANGLVREAGATALIRGTNLGVNSLASQTASATNLQLNTPNLVGSAGANTTDGGILVGVVGDTNSGGTGFGTTGGLLTYDATNGVRLLSSGEYKTTITNGQSQLDNVRLSSASGVVTTTINSDTTINSLSLQTSGATSAAISVGGTGKLTLNSGVIYSNSVTATAGSTISNTIDFSGREGVVLVGGTNNLTLSGALTNTGGNGLTVYAPTRSVTLSGTSANTYTGTTTVNGGTLTLNKTAGIDAIAGDVLVNSGGALSQSASNQIADTANVTINGGSFSYRTETINNLSVTNSGSASAASSNGINLTLGGSLTVADGASLSTGVSSALTVAGPTTLSNGGTLTLSRSQSTTGAYDSVATLNGGLAITHTASGAYTAITIGNGAGTGQSGAKLILGGDVSFTGNATNTNTVYIDAIKGTGGQGVIELTSATPGNRTFNIGNGAAATDLAITAALLDGAGGASGLVKTGAGTLALSGASTYSGNTTVSAGGLTLAQGGSLTFYIGANGVNNFVGGTGTATFAGSFNFDLTNAAAIDGNSWLIVDAANLSESFTGTFVLNGFTETANVWTLGNYSFSEATGVLTYGAIPEPASFALLAAAGLFGFTAFRRHRRTA